MDGQLAAADVVVVMGSERARRGSRAAMIGARRFAGGPLAHGAHQHLCFRRRVKDTCCSCIGGGGALECCARSAQAGSASLPEAVICIDASAVRARAARPPILPS